MTSAPVLDQGEQLVYEYIFEEYLLYLAAKTRSWTMEEILDKVWQIEVKLLEEYEQKVEEYIRENFPVASVCKKWSALSHSFNDVNCVREHGWSGHFGQDKRGLNPMISYKDIEQSTGVSSKIAKDILQRLEARGVINRTKEMGGYRYSISLDERSKSRISAEISEFSPYEYSFETRRFEPVDCYDDVIRFAEKYFSIEECHECSVHRLRKELGWNQEEDDD